MEAWMMGSKERCRNKMIKQGLLILERKKNEEIRMKAKDR